MKTDGKVVVSSGNGSDMSGNDSGLSGNDSRLSGNDSRLSGNGSPLSGNDSGLSGNDSPEVLARRLSLLVAGGIGGEGGEGGVGVGVVPLAAAESCTGGMASAMLTSCSGASSWFGFGVVSYSDAAKTALLGVSPELLSAHGAVSEEVAAAMCAGLLERGAGCGFAITGIAGPEGGSLEKPVGTVCFGWMARGFGTRTATAHFAGDREDVRRSSALFALRGMAEMLEEWS